MLGLAGLDLQAEKLKRQQALADKMRATTQEGMKGVQAGRIYKAPGWGNALASIAGNAAGAYQDKQIMGQYDDMGLKTTDALKKYYGSL